MYPSGPVRLSTMLGTYPKTDPLKQHAVSSTQLELDIAPVEVAQKAFKDIVRGQKYDVAEIAIVTFLQAHAAGKPYVLLPFVMNGQFHHKSILVRKDAPFTAASLAGKRIAMRSYAQTTPTWCRGILMDDYGLQLESVTWMSQEEAHVAEYKDPPWVQQLDSALSLEKMLIAGEVDAILGGALHADASQVRSLIPNAREAALQWYALHQAVPINHMVAVRRELAEERPDLVREVFRMLKESRQQGDSKPLEDGINLQPSGFELIQPALEMVVRYAVAQKLIPRAVSTEALYGPVLQALG